MNQEVDGVRRRSLGPVVPLCSAQAARLAATSRARRPPPAGGFNRVSHDQSRYRSHYRSRYLFDFRHHSIDLAIDITFDLATDLARSISQSISLSISPSISLSIPLSMSPSISLSLALAGNSGTQPPIQIGLEPASGNPGTGNPGTWPPAEIGRPHSPNLSISARTPTH